MHVEIHIMGFEARSIQALSNLLAPLSASKRADGFWMCGGGCANGIVLEQRPIFQTMDVNILKKQRILMKDLWQTVLDFQNHDH